MTSCSHGEGGADDDSSHGIESGNGEARPIGWPRGPEVAATQMWLSQGKAAVDGDAEGDRRDAWATMASVVVS